MKKRSIHQSSHPFHACPFEAFYNGSWKAVECLRIRAGAKTKLLIDDGDVFEENFPITNLRIRSRKATLSDCTCFLRPGLDVCVLSTCQLPESSSEEDNLEPVWLDAKIKSIERKPHEPNCACQFYVSFYVTQGPLGVTKKTLHNDTIAVQIDQIFILQNLERNPCENEHYRWDFSEDCSSLQKYKLFPGKFSSDISWLLVASVQKNIEVDVRSIQKRIVYQILDDDWDKCAPNLERKLNAVSFKVENGISVPIIVPFALGKGTDCDINKDETLSLYELMGLRRSKRRCVQPELYSGRGDLSDSDVDVAQIGICKTYGGEYEDMTLPTTVQADRAYYSDNHSEGAERVHSYERDIRGCQGKIKSRGVKSVVSNLKERQSQIANQRKTPAKPSVFPMADETDQMVHEEDPLDAHIPGNFSGDVGEILSEVDFTEAEGEWGRKGVRERKGSLKKFHRKMNYSMFSERDSYCNSGIYRKRSLSASMCREMMKRCMENIESSVSKEQPLFIDQWNKIRAADLLNGGDSGDIPSADEEHNSEIETLWNQMELCMASTCLLEDSEGSKVEVPAEVAQDTRKHCGQVCRHEYKLNEEIGILCQLCGFVDTEIKDVPPTFWQCTSWIPNKGPLNPDTSEQKLDEDVGLFDLFRTHATSNMPLSEGEDNVWVLIPDLKRKLRLHQKRAFEFLWRNLAGSLVPEVMKPTVKKRGGGCVISHSPGAGKTLLIIAFLVSYLKLFPGSRPLVICPKTTLYTWYKETKKWEIPVPVYQIQGNRTYRGEALWQKLRKSTGAPKTNRDVMHVLDSMEKIQKWLAHPSVLLMGYSTFMTFTREDSKFAHRKYMGQLLRQCTGILILDEGHNPRSNQSTLRKSLMKVETRLRILLSGTLFQNNFAEFFNTLTLARPSFVNEVLSKLDPKFRRRKKDGKTLTQIENRARKLFLEKIARKINLSVAEERMQGLIMLKNLTSEFIDVYDGGSSDNLPGLQCYTLMMKSTPYQQELLIKIQNQMPKYKGFPLEKQFLVTLLSIHPWLLRTTSAASQYFDEKELEGLEKHKLDLKLGSKVRFVMSLLPSCLFRREKVLIFCHNIAPINLFLEIFEAHYGWRKGEEVLVLQGEMELFERGMVMDKFEERGGGASSSKVLLASITACGEGISLTAASRVIFLDSEWNPSKTKQAIARAFRPGQAKVVYVYQLLATGTVEEDKFSRTTWKERVSSMIFSKEEKERMEGPSLHRQAEKIKDDVLRVIVEEDRATLFHRIMLNEKASNRPTHKR